MPTKYRHFYLYAKGWYKRTDLLADLRKIASEFSGTDVNAIYQGHVLSILEDALTEQLNNHPFAFTMFFRKVVQHSSVLNVNTRQYEEVPVGIALIRACMEIMHVTGRDYLLDGLGDPDPNILPLSEDGMG